MAKSRLVEALKRFNRKERYWLVADAVGEPFLTLSPAFIDKINLALEANVPSNAWWAFDYHLDWLYAVLSAGSDFNIDRLMREPPRTNAPEVIKGNQEDVDLVIAFDETIILIEAKLWTGWSSKQAKSKGERLKSLPIENVQPHFLLASPGAPRRVDYEGWPKWALPNQGKLPAHMVFKGNKGERISQVSRSEGGIPMRKKGGGCWSVFNL